MNKIKKWILSSVIIVLISLSIGFQSDFFEVAKQIDIYTTLFKELNKYYIDEINPAEINEKSLNHMLSNLDPYTRFFDEQGVESSRIRSTGNYGGIGVSSRYRDKTLTIREIFKNSPAEKAGVKAGDIILKINDIIVKDFEGDGVTSLLSGLPDSKINLKIQRQNNIKNLTIKREKIEINPVPFYTMLENNIGYISFITFNEKASSKVKEAFLDLKDEGMQKLIIDVRGNPGGLLNEAVKIVNFFVPKGKTVVTTKAKIKKWSNTFTTKKEPLDLEIPLTILINNRSASASEILAGALQDYDRAVIIGKRSYGKGLVQRYLPLSYGTQMKLTISKYYTPSGRCIQELDYSNRDKNGVVPKFSDNGREEFETSKGRKVLGGGGISPDIKLKKPETTKVTEVLYNSDAFFNYVTQYFYNNVSIEAPSRFNLNNSEYDNLKEYLINHQSDYETDTEKELSEIKKTANKEKINKKIEESYSNFLNEIYKVKIEELDINKDEILSRLTEEIVKRYYYKEGVYKQKAVFDKTIVEAISLFNDIEKHKNILRK